MSQKIVLFGGSFDPVHHGHLIVARNIAEQLGVERVQFVPAGSPPHKAATQVSAKHRLAMLKLAIADEPLFGLCELELHREGPSYTIDTVEELRREHGPHAKLYWVIGADMLEDIYKWRRIGELMEIVDFVVACRAPFHATLNDTFTALEGRLNAFFVNNLRRAVIATPLIDISSTDIRSRVAAGRPISYLVPPAVQEYIRHHRLYRNIAASDC